MQGLTIHEAARTTGWSSRMLRYLERVGLIEPPRTGAGYRLFGPAELSRLRTLRELVSSFDCGLSDVAFARRMRDDERLRAALERWFEQPAARPAGVPACDWLRFEQEKHERLLRSLPEAGQREETIAGPMSVPPAVTGVPARAGSGATLQASGHATGRAARSGLLRIRGGGLLHLATTSAPRRPPLDNDETETA